MRKALIIVVLVVMLLVFGCSSIQRKLLFYPSHHHEDFGLTAWKKDGKIIGYSRQVADPANVWLMLHGNGGQAADRAYAIPSFSAKDSVFILEYPGYGEREGTPSKASFDAAAAEAYALLRETFPKTPVCVAAESIGSGPACALANQPRPPEKFALIVPFDDLASVASDHVPFLPVRLILGSTWNNIDALSKYKGPVEIFGATRDQVIRIDHARALAAAVPSARFHEIDGGHNEWPQLGRVKITNP